MKVYKNQTEQSAKQLGFYANFSFASDEIMSPNGIDITPVRKAGESEPYCYELTEYDKQTRLAKISVMNKKEYGNYLKTNSFLQGNETKG